MKLSKLSLKNIAKSFKDYAIYFFTLILGVAIFYVFNAIDSQTVLLDVTKDTRDIIKLMTNLLSGVSVFVSFILGFLIIYASRFLIKRRNKEFGIYLTLGMSKRKISMILFFETLFIGLISLFIGTILGVALSQLMSLLVANMFEANLTSFAFTFSKSACLKTLIYFSIMYLLVMIFNTININKCKLINLLYASKVSEEVKLKNSLLCTIIFLVSAAFLGYAYYLVTGGISTLDNTEEIFKPIIIGAVSTFFIFWSLSGLILRLVMSLKNLYYKKLNSFIVRQISSKINTTVMSMTVICLMLFVTICVLSSALSIKNSMTANLKTLAPMDIEFSKKLNLTESEISKSWNLTNNMIEDSKLSLSETLTNLDYDYKEKLKDIIEFNVYESDITMKDTLGDYYEEIKNKYPYFKPDTIKEMFVKVSDYNKLLKSLNKEEITLKNNEYALIIDYQEFINFREQSLKNSTKITINSKDYYPKSNEPLTGFIIMSSTNSNTGFFVIPDEVASSMTPKESILIANYKEENDQGKEMAESLVNKIFDHSYKPQTSINIVSKLALYESSVGLGAMVTFIGLYLGLIFLISSAAILALKELSESTDNKERFKILRRIGAPEKLLNESLFKQIGLFFMFPLLIAIIHSIFGIKFCNYILSVFGNEKLLPSIIMTSIFIVVIYGGYFLITYFCSKNIIKEK